MLSLGNKIPDLRSLYKHVVPKYAHRWRDLGVHLQFDHSTLQIIHTNYRNDAEECCKDLLHRWLKRETSATATWDRLFSAIDHLSQEFNSSEKGLALVMCYLDLGILLTSV